MTDGRSGVGALKRNIPPSTGRRVTRVAVAVGIAGDGIVGDVGEKDAVTFRSGNAQISSDHQTAIGIRFNDRAGRQRQRRIGCHGYRAAQIEDHIVAP